MSGLRVPILGAPLTDYGNPRRPALPVTCNKTSIGFDTVAAAVGIAGKMICVPGGRADLGNSHTLALGL